MKVKLLKRVRKHYSIIKMSEFPTWWDGYDKQQHCVGHKILPVYMIWCKSKLVNTSQTYDGALGYLIEDVKALYEEEVKGHRGVFETVWYKK